MRDAKSPLYIWGPSKSHIRNPWYGSADSAEEPEYFDDGTIAFAKAFREMNRWHTESQSFVGTRYVGAEGDGYEIVVTELNWANGGKTGQWSNNLSLRELQFAWSSPATWVAYEDRSNQIRISRFPAVHDRNGSISYLLEWNGLSMIFSGGTKPNMFMLDALRQAPKPVDLLIPEMAASPSEPMRDGHRMHKHASEQIVPEVPSDSFMQRRPALAGSKRQAAQLAPRRQCRFSLLAIRFSEGGANASGGADGSPAQALKLGAPRTVTPTGRIGAVVDAAAWPGIGFSTGPSLFDWTRKRSDPRSASGAVCALICSAIVGAPTLPFTAG
ncbi:MAG: hypothetical protein ROZ64_17390 [Burkholderiaceae bacterium]|nr:hypothetical protein [Burkholderiaceae bacterium]